MRGLGTLRKKERLIRRRALAAPPSPRREGFEKIRFFRE